MNSEPLSPDLLLENLGWMRRLAKSLVRHDVDAEDVVQETWAVALKRGVDPTRSPKAYLGEILRRVALGFRRREGYRKTEALPEPVSHAAEPGELVDRASLQRSIVDAVLRLEEPYRSTILMRYFDSQEPTDIANRLGIPAGTVRARLSRGLELVRADLDDQSGGRTKWSSIIFLWVPDVLKPVSAAVAATSTTSTYGLVLTGIAILLVGGTFVIRSLLDAEPVGQATRSPTRPDVAAGPQDATKPASPLSPTPFPGEKEPTLTGHVVNQSGAALPDARILLFPAAQTEMVNTSVGAKSPKGSEELTTDQEGRVATLTPVTHPFYGIFTEAPGYGFDIALIDIGASTAFSVVLHPDSRIRGRITSSTGAGVGDAEVSWEACTLGCIITRTVRSDAQGHYSIPGLPSLLSYERGILEHVTRLSVSAKGHAPSRISDPATPDQKGVAMQDVQLDPVTPVVGTIVAEEFGNPIPNAEIRIWRTIRNPASRGVTRQSLRDPLAFAVVRTTSDLEGQFRVESVPGSMKVTGVLEASPLSLAVNAPGRATRILTWQEIPNEPVRIGLRRAVRVIGRVVDATGQAAPDVAVFIEGRISDRLTWPPELPEDRGKVLTDSDRCSPDARRSRATSLLRVSKEIRHRSL